MSYVFIFRSFRDEKVFNCLRCKGKFVKIMKVSVCFRNNAGKDLSSWFCEDCFKEMFSYDNETKVFKRGIYREKDPDPNLTRKKSKPYLCQSCKLTETCQNNFDYECVEASDCLCYDIKCGSFGECDKIHCHQFYEYTEKGIIKRELKNL